MLFLLFIMIIIKENKNTKEDLIEEVKKLLKKYPNTYLEQSTFINGGKDETLA